MSSQLLIKVADVLDALADENSRLVAEKQAAERDRKTAIIEPVLGKLAFLYGETEEDLKEKLANANEDMLDMLSKVAGIDNVSALGGPSTYKTAAAPKTRNEAARAAGDQFAQCCIS